MKIGIYGISNEINVINVLNEISSFFISKRIQIFICEKFENFSEFPKFTSFDNLDFLVTIGGDGTILSAITKMKRRNIPILGINLGKLGFLATINLNEIHEKLGQFLDGNYNILNRTMLSVFTSNGQQIRFNSALNEIAINRKDTTSIITIDVSINGKYLNSYWADGLIVSTPTGSTGYSLSCGGPIIMPEVETFIITPIAPHNLNVRPLIISEKDIINIKVSNREGNYLLSLDSRISTLDNDCTLTIQKSDLQIKTIVFSNDNFYTTLSEKLYWGIDKRN